MTRLSRAIKFERSHRFYISSFLFYFQSQPSSRPSLSGTSTPDQSVSICRQKFFPARITTDQKAIKKTMNYIFQKTLSFNVQGISFFVHGRGKTAPHPYFSVLSHRFIANDPVKTEFWMREVLYLLIN